ncbi:hypothetical protein LOC08_07920 [Lactobacillus delbrueckii subsp. lactis]|nr:hypothetical protein [Lactobacillus delbrueckii]MCD5507153.1 hypothetical protein [Lactobacillus delbrueckii subsp. lactis]MCD5520347.1 hypothetical protein [Lactobacillus delbrueckii subsp. lactis]MCD5524237.1 hypothetical protein [Lactobacillus delbrueckii subsp. lactis]MCD5526136.1 hypothetical protein [Lactobacillus delbrueckii subsp. lactis]
MTAFTGVDSQNLPDVMVSVQFILAIGELQSMALKQYIKQLAPEKLQQLIKNPDISEADLKLIQKNTGNETIKQLATEKLQHLNSQAIQESLNSYRRLHDARGWAASIARGQSLNDLKYRYKNATPDEKVKIRDILHNAN